MTTHWTDLGPADLQDGEMALRKTEAGARYLVVKTPQRLHVLNERCPHQGYPLSQGTVNNGELTCAWHNWKFDVCTGACPQGDSLPKWPSRVRDGRVQANLHVNLGEERRAAEAGILVGLRDNDPERALRDALRLRKASGASMDPAFAVLAIDAAQRGPWGFGHELASLSDLLEWVDARDVTASEGFSVAATIVAERLAREPQRESEAAREGTESTLHEMLRSEDRGSAEAESRRITDTQGVDAAIAALLPYAAGQLLSYGHGLIYVAKARALARRIPTAATEIMAALAVQLGWATNETALPPWAATRRALETLQTEAISDRALQGRGEFERSVLHSESAAGQAAVQQLNDGVAPRHVLIAIAHAAAVRLSAFDPAWVQRRDVDVGILDVSHAVTFAEAALDLLHMATPADAARLAVLAASFVGKLKGADGPRAEPTESRSGMQDILLHRDEGQFRGFIQELSPQQRLQAYRDLRPFATFEAYVRPIFVAHAIKGLEALERLERQDPAPDSAYLEAFAHLAVHRWPERDPRRSAATAEQFMADGRPPRGLY